MHCFKLALVGISICCTVIYSCNPPEYLSEKDLSQYVSDNDKLSKSVTSGNIQVKAIYKPTDLLVAQEIKIKENQTPLEINDARNKYNNHYYFIISFSNSGKELLNTSTVGMAGFSELLQTMSFRMAEIVNLTTSKQDTIPVSDFIHNRTFGMSNSTDLLFVFDKSKAQGQEWIQINLDEFGLGIGKQSIRFNTRDLENAPKIFKL